MLDVGVTYDLARRIWAGKRSSRVWDALIRASQLKEVYQVVLVIAIVVD